MTTTDTAPTLPRVNLDSIDVHFTARVGSGGMASVHRDPERPDQAIVAVNSHVRFRLGLEDCPRVAETVLLAAERGAAETILSTNAGFYLYENPCYSRTSCTYYRLSIGSPLRKTIHVGEVTALAAVLACFVRHLEASGA